MDLDQFKPWAVGQVSVGKATDGGYVGECVSLINQYLFRVYGISAGAWGNARDWATSADVAEYFDKVSSPQVGDIGVMGDGYGWDPITKKYYGHIFIYLSPTTILEQNGKIARKVDVTQAYANPIAILRRKGTVNMATQAEINRVGTMAINDDWEGQIHTLQHQLADAQNANKFTNPVNGDVRDAAGWFAAYDERNTQMIGALATINTLKDQLKTASQGGSPVDTALLDELSEVLSKITARDK